MQAASAQAGLRIGESLDACPDANAMHHPMNYFFKCQVWVMTFAVCPIPTLKLVMPFHLPGSEGMRKRLSCRRQSLLLAACLMGAAPYAFGTLTVSAYYDATIGGNAQMVSTINNTLALYGNLFSTNINVSIYFQNGGGLGASQATFYSGSYGTICSALAASKTSADDTTAVAATGSCGGSNPVTGTSSIAFSSANGRALGLGTAGTLSAGGHTGLDSIITLNASIMNITRPDSNPSFYDMQSVVEHEVDEVLGTASGVNGAISGLATTADLFRYSGSGLRSFVAPGTAYLSVDGGATNLATYNNVTNCNISAGDCGDFDLSALRVQNWASTPGATPDVTLGSPEARLLDVVGYTLVSSVVPEPATLSLFALGFGLLGAAGKLRRR
jgi:PEP-CTERM motif